MSSESSLLSDATNCFRNSVFSWALAPPPLWSCSYAGPLSPDQVVCPVSVTMDAQVGGSCAEVADASQLLSHLGSANFHLFLSLSCPS